MAGRPHPKDWERKLRVMALLYERGLNITRLSEALGVSRPHLNEVICGTRRSPVGETRIAAYFGMARFDLFPKKPRRQEPEGVAA
jgi:lambda repressor-like predicted transcriptional regulator